MTVFNYLTLLSILYCKQKKKKTKYKLYISREVVDTYIINENIVIEHPFQPKQEKYTRISIRNARVEIVLP